MHTVFHDIFEVFWLTEGFVLIDNSENLSGFHLCFCLSLISSSEWFYLPYVQFYLLVTIFILKLVEFPQGFRLNSSKNTNTVQNMTPRSVTIPDLSFIVLPLRWAHLCVTQMAIEKFLSLYEGELDEERFRFLNHDVLTDNFQ